MSSWIDPRALNPKRQKAAPLENDTEGASFLLFEDHETFFRGSDELEDHVKDSQDEGSGFHQGGLQDSSGFIEPAVGDVLSRETAQGDEHGHYHWGPTSEILAEQESDRITSRSLHSSGGFLSSTSWKAKQSRPFPRKDSREAIPGSLGLETGKVSLAQQLQELTGETAHSDAHAFMRFRDNELSSEPRGIPLALRLEALVQQAQDTAPSNCLPHPQRRVEELTGETRDSDVHTLARYQHSELRLESGGIPLALRLQELVQQASATAPSTFLPHPKSREKQVDRRQHTYGKKSASSLKSDWSAIEDDIVENFDTRGKKFSSSTKNDRPAIEDDIAENFDSPWKQSAASANNRPAMEDDIVENFDCSGHRQKKSPEKDTSAVPAVPTYLLWERFQEALESAPPLGTTPTSTDQLNFNQAPSGFLERLQNALKKVKSQQAQFQKSLTSRRSLHGLSQCLVVLISGKRLEAQLTTCQCKLLESPPKTKKVRGQILAALEWNRAMHVAVTAVESSDNLPDIEVIFSSKMSGDLDLEVGRVVRVHPPWQEIHGAGMFGKIILGTFFCEMVE